MLRIACRSMDGIVHLSFPYLVLSCEPKAHVSVHPSRGLPGKPLPGSGQQNRRGRPDSATAHNDQERNGPTPATARHK